MTRQNNKNTAATTNLDRALENLILLAVYFIIIYSSTENGKNWFVWALVRGVGKVQLYIHELLRLPNSLLVLDEH